MPVERMLEGELATIRCAGANSTDDLVGAVFSLLSDPDLPEHDRRGSPKGEDQPVLDASDEDTTEQLPRAAQGGL